MSKKWWKYAGIRALKTICQTAVATIGTAVVMEDVNWLAVASASLLAGVLSLLTSLAGIPEVDDYGIQDTFNEDGLMELVEKGIVDTSDRYDGLDEKMEVDNVHNQDE
jgi:hypothetical protein